jgi:hypothetical protein
MYYSYIEIEYIATSFSPTRTDLALKLLPNLHPFDSGIGLSIDAAALHTQGEMLKHPKKLQKAGPPICFYIIKIFMVGVN